MAFHILRTRVVYVRRIEVNPVDSRFARKKVKQIINNFISQKQSEFDLFKQFKLEQFYLAGAKTLSPEISIHGKTFLLLLLFLLLFLLLKRKLTGGSWKLNIAKENIFIIIVDRGRRIARKRERKSSLWKSNFYVLWN